MPEHAGICECAGLARVDSDTLWLAGQARGCRMQGASAPRGTHERPAAGGAGTLPAELGQCSRMEAFSAFTNRLTAVPGALLAGFVECTRLSAPLRLVQMAGVRAACFGSYCPGVSQWV